MSSRIPPLLEPYLALPPEASLILLTSVLGASSNWLVLRFLHSTLIRPEPLSESPREDDAKLVLVSFMRDFAFWKENGRRLVGISSIFHLFTLLISVSKFSCRYEADFFFLDVGS